MWHEDQPRSARSASSVHIQICQGHKRPNVLIDVGQRFAGQLDPRVREELPARAAHTDTHDSTIDPTVGQHP